MTGPAGEFAQQLRLLRETHGLSVRALAERVGVSKVTLWKWERGDNEPRERHLLPLAAALNVNPDDLRVSTQRRARPSPQASGLAPADQAPSGEDRPEPDSGGQAKELSEVIARAKQMIADASGVGPKNISITIEY